MAHVSTVQLPTQWLPVSSSGLWRMASHTIHTGSSPSPRVLPRSTTHSSSMTSRAVWLRNSAANCSFSRSLMPLRSPLVVSVTLSRPAVILPGILHRQCLSSTIHSVSPPSLSLILVRHSTIRLLCSAHCMQ